MPPPAIVVVPASFTPAEFYLPFLSTLEKHGIQALAVALPSTGDSNSSQLPGSLSDDAAKITQVVNKLLDSPDSCAADDAKEIVLMGHSYGGIPACESMKSISAKSRAAEGKKGGVKKIILLAGIVLPVGVSNNEMRKRPPPAHASAGVSFSFLFSSP
jgi:surfactin synthase thioesterase subunit